MSNNIRIKTTPNGSDKYVKLKLDQNFDFIEILSLKVSQEETYRKFCSDYGAIVGRVIVNNGFGIPNAKVSVFIPIDEVDKLNSEIVGLYPFETVSDKDSQGIRYNLLPRNAENNNNCFTPVGTFPSKREILDDETVLSVYCKYYKYTTTTNYAGDFMLFGVPIGTYTLHVDADISDIGYASQRPYDLIRQGTPEKFFESATKFKADKNLDRLVQIKTANIGVNVQPFWGDLENCEIGFTRADLDLNYTLSPAAIFMGSIYGDQNKNSVNKRCRPRRKMGNLCDQVVNTGTIEVLRKNVDDLVEQVIIDDAKIDEDGTWAFQIPMNLDYMVTNEFGELVLTNDPNIGIPTRAKVRFRIGMDENGREGRLRTRAKYLVPNNPQTQNEIDYNFNEKTKDTSFKNLYWNKIYTVSNFISRFQKENTGVSSENMVGVKDVDSCVGTKTPFPYNRVNTTGNPIFFIVCLLIRILAFFIYVINFTIIPVLNFLISAVNAIIDAVNGLTFGIFSIPNINYIPCISVRCPTEDGALFAPGCRGGSNEFNASVDAPNYYCGDAEGHVCDFGSAVGLDDCMAFEMARGLDMYKFDFYNDWVTGVLYGFLLKYKRRRNGVEKFCEYDCGDANFINDPNYSGVDGNKNGIKDNECFNEKLLDSCVPCNGDDCQKESRSTNTIREGLIKKYDGEFYYASTTHNAAFKLYATDIVCLGSVLDCDWQGFPKLQPFLTETTYTLPPEIQEKTDDNTIVLESGMVDIGGTTNGLFFSINCGGLHMNRRQVLNVRHACEIFVDGDETIIDDLTNTIVQQADGILGNLDIDSPVGKEFRDAFIVLNSGTTSANRYVLNPDMVSGFNLGDCGEYDFTSNLPSPCNPNIETNGDAYINFRGYEIGADNIYAQPKKSFYLYFGMIPGKTALDKMNQRYFIPCSTPINNDVIIDATTTNDILGNCTGAITFTFVGGQGPYDFTINGPNYYFSGNTNGGPPTVDVNGLCEGVYVISGFDSLGNPATQTISINGPTPLYCSTFVTRNVTSVGLNDGEITISSIGGGIAPYSYSVFDSLGNLAGNPSTGLNVVTPLIISGLGVEDNGYTVVVTDASNNECITENLVISGPSAINLTSNYTNVTCYNGNDGQIVINYNGGQSPYLLTTTGPMGFTSSSPNMDNLIAGTYVTTIVDDLGTTASITTTITNINPRLTIAYPPATDLAKQCDINKYFIPFYITEGLAPNSTAYIEYMVDMSGNWIRTNLQYFTQNDLIYLEIPKNAINNDIRIRFSNTSDYTCLSNVLLFNVASMQLPLTQLFGSITRSGTGPYTYVINVNGGTAPYTGVPYNVGTNNNIAAASITTTITDSVGCIITLNYP
jgi:hypothetical protein